MKRHVSLTHRTVLDTVGTLRLFRQAARLLHDLPIRPSGHQSGRRAADPVRSVATDHVSPTAKYNGCGLFWCEWMLLCIVKLRFVDLWFRLGSCLPVPDLP